VFTTVFEKLKIKALYWNCCGGISGKILKVKHVTDKFNPEIFFVSESEFTPDHTWIRIDGYDTIPT